MESNQSAIIRSKAETILAQMWSTMSLDLGPDKNGNPQRYPRNLREVRILKDGLRQLRALNCPDAEVVKLVKDFEEHLKHTTSRSFEGSSLLIGLIVLAVFILGALAWFWGPKPMTAAEAIEQLPLAVEAEKNVLVERSKLLATATTEEARKQLAEDQVKSSRRLIELQNMTSWQYQIDYNNNIRSFEDSWPKLLGMLGLALLYYLSARVPFYQRLKRQKFLRRWKQSRGIIAVIVGLMATALWSVPTRETTVYWSDGSQDFHSNAGEWFLVQIAFYAALLIAFVYALYYILPIIVALNFIVNYSAMAFDKLFGRHAPLIVPLNKA